MKFIVTSDTMKQIERETITNYHIDSMLLMERAAFAIVERIKAVNGRKALFICGMGNNGADGVAAARILACEDHKHDILLMGDEKKSTIEMKKQLKMIKKLGMNILKIPDANIKNDTFTTIKNKLSEYDVIIDAIFGIGFHGIAEGLYKEVIELVNGTDAYVISVDMPSGISADTGDKNGEAVYADETVTFGLGKLGLTLYPNAEHAGNVIICDIGFPKQIINEACTNAYACYEKTDISNMLPVRMNDSHKGTYGKVLVIAGSDDSPGAGYLAAAAAYRSGAGLVKVFSSRRVTDMVNIKLPEALTVAYDDELTDSPHITQLASYDKGKTRMLEKLENALEWSTTVMIGSGLTTGIVVKDIFDFALSNYRKPFVIDADAINILSDWLDEEQIMNMDDRIQVIAKMLPKYSILTPHLKELSRLTGIDTMDIKRNLVDISNRCSYNNKLVFVIKDSRSLIVSSNKKFINLSGNSGMATGGSGDVLSGIITAYLGFGLEPMVAASFGAYVHGLAGDMAAARKGKHSMLAGDIIDELCNVGME